MEKKYSKTEFQGYTHRFVVVFETGGPHTRSMDIYSNSDSRQELESFINETKTDKVLSFKIVHRASKEQDEMATQLINETLAGI